MVGTLRQRVLWRKGYANAHAGITRMLAYMDSCNFDLVRKRSGRSAYLDFPRSVRKVKYVYPFWPMHPPTGNVDETSCVDPSAGQEIVFPHRSISEYIVSNSFGKRRCEFQLCSKPNTTSKDAEGTYNQPLESQVLVPNATSVVSCADDRMM